MVIVPDGMLVAAGRGSDQAHDRAFHAWGSSHLMLSDADHFRLICLICIEESGDLPDGCDGFDLRNAGLIREADGRWRLTEIGARFVAENGIDELTNRWGHYSDHQAASACGG
jgi:hypothetical protein